MSNDTSINDLLDYLTNVPESRRIAEVMEPYRIAKKPGTVTLKEAIENLARAVLGVSKHIQRTKPDQPIQVR